MVKSLLVTFMIFSIQSSFAQVASGQGQLECWPSSGALPGPSIGIMNTAGAAVFVTAQIGHYLVVDLVCNYSGNCTGFMNGNSLIEPGKAKLLKDSTGRPQGFKYGAFAFNCK